MKQAMTLEILNSKAAAAAAAASQVINNYLKCC